MKFLLIDRDKKIANTILKSLNIEALTIDIANTGQEGFMLATTQSYHLIISELVLPETNTLELLRNLRNTGIKIPIVILSKKDSLEDRVQAFSEGADDFLSKPIVVPEFVARVEALLRRDQWRVSETVLEIADLKIDLVKREVKRNQQIIDLTLKELSLLEYLVRRRGQAITRNMIAEEVWEQRFDVFTNVIDVYVRYLRKKMDEGFSPQLIHTVRGVGYTVDIKKDSETKGPKEKTKKKKVVASTENDKKKKKKAKSVSKKS